MRANEKPGQANPYISALIFTALMALVAGAIMIFAGEDPRVTLAGGVVGTLGAVAFAGWLVAEAILWRAREVTKADTPA